MASPTSLIFRTRKEFLKSRRSEQFVLYLFLILPILFILVFTGYPVIYNLILSFQQADVTTLSATRRPFIGFANYSILLRDNLFWTVLKNSLLFTAGSITFQFILGLILAIFFEKNFSMAPFLRGLIVAGWMVPSLVVGTVWKWLLNTDFGIINYLLMMLHLIHSKVSWLVSPGSALFSVILANIWFGIPFNMLLLSAGLAGIPAEIYDAAKVDGASGIKQIRHITLPMLKPTIFAVLILGLIYTLKVFDLIWVMTRGGPTNATNVLPVWSYQLSFEFFNFGQGAAIANVLFLILLALAFLYVTFAVQREEELL